MNPERLAKFLIVPSVSLVFVSNVSCFRDVEASPAVTGRFGPIPVRIPGRFGPITFRSGRCNRCNHSPGNGCSITQVKTCLHEYKTWYFLAGTFRPGSFQPDFRGGSFRPD